MFKIDLSDYKESSIHFNLFDTLIVGLEEGKEKYLRSLGINPSTYRKCRKGDLKIGHDIIVFLANHYSLTILKNEEYDELSKMFTSIYDKLYYKIEFSYDEDLKLIEDMIEKNYIIHPVIKLVKLFVVMCSNKTRESIISENIDLYNEIKIYKQCFNNSLIQIYEIVSLFYEENIEEGKGLKNYKNGFIYYILATRAYSDKKYIESIFYAMKAKEILDADGNVLRNLHVNNILMSSFLYVGNYEECNELANKQLLTIRSIGLGQGFHRRSASKYLFVSLLGLDRCEEIIELCEVKKMFNLTELTCYLVAMFRLDKNMYEAYFDGLDLNVFNEKDKKYLITIDEYLRTNHRKVLKDLTDYDVMGCLINII